MIFIPKVNAELTVTLPAEQLRARVTRVIDVNTCIVQIGQPFMKTHQFRKDDLVPCRRTPGLLGETWQAIEHRPMAPPDIVPETKPKLIPKRQKQAVSGSKTINSKSKNVKNSKTATPRKAS